MVAAQLGDEAGREAGVKFQVPELGGVVEEG